MECEDCGSESRVIDSRKRGKGVYRRRECLNPKCAKRFTTVETVAAREVRKLRAPSAPRAEKKRKSVAVRRAVEDVRADAEAFDEDITEIRSRYGPR